MIKNIIHIKTTLLGIVVLGFTGYYFKDLDTTPFYILLGVGLALILAPDTFVKSLKTLVSKKSKEL